MCVRVCQCVLRPGRGDVFPKLHTFTQVLEANTHVPIPESISSFGARTLSSPGHR